ncbi:MAG TPA: hypothetical protein VD994_18120 [Prosthecobacter sp.]|nr:hypothetical protein [Prosthecobacter sp.]
MKNFLAILLFLGGFGYWGWHYYTQKTTARIQDISAQLPPLEQLVAQKRAELAAVTNAVEVQKKAAATREALNVLTARQKLLNDEKTALLRQRQTLTSTSRQSLIGVVLTDLTLADGRKLNQARVMKVDDTGVSFAVPSGVLRVTPRELTPELRDYFRLAP